jgi:hypothetical protein
MCSKCIYRLIALVLAMVTTPVSSAEYSDEDILPNIVTIMFADEAIGFIGRRMYYPKNRDKPYFVLYRDKAVGQEVDLAEFQSIFPAVTDENSVRKKGKYTLLTSDGYSYEVTNHDLFCEWVPSASEYAFPIGYSPVGETNHTMILSDTVIQTHVHICNVITAVEHVDDRLWIGTGYDGDHGRHVGQGVVVQNRKTERLELTVSEMGAWTNQIRLDPYSGDVWVASSHIVNRMATDGRHVARYHFFKEFDLTTGMPSYFISSKPGKTNPLAVIASIMNEHNAKSLSRLSQAIPKEDAEAFGLYGFFMCCSARKNEYLPESMNAMVPLIIDELEVLVERRVMLDGAYDAEVDILQERWIQALCKFDDPQVLPYIRGIATQETKHPARLVNSCIEKLQ